MFGRPARVYAVLVNEWDALWGLFDSEKKALQAIEAWGLADRVDSYEIVAYEMNYRLKSMPPRYLSDALPQRQTTKVPVRKEAEDSQTIRKASSGTSKEEA